jgi:hypothetical protein
MSAFHPISTKSRTSRHFGFGPTTDILKGASRRDFGHLIFTASTVAIAKPLGKKPNLKASNFDMKSANG